MIAIIGVLVGMLLPAVQAAREAARRGTCQTHLHQFALALQNHHEAHSQFPTGGWSFVWTGDADRGSARDQPGGWLYNLLPYVEESALHDLGKGQPVAEKRRAAAGAAATPFGIANCPSRRAVALYPYTGTKPVLNAEPAADVMKSDYAASAGDLVTGGEGPATLEAAETHDWGTALDATGLLFTRSEVKLAQVVDGSSHTYAVGEKRVQLGTYDWGDDQHGLVGHGTDVARYANLDHPPKPDGVETKPALQRSFGSSHPEGCWFAMADGSVQWVGYDVDPEVHRQRGNRADQGEP